MKSATMLSAPPKDEFVMPDSRAIAPNACALLGHHFDNRAAAIGHCHCGEAWLQADRSAVHIRHNLACLLGGHTYEKIGEREGHCEYVCESCGHPMLFAMGVSPYASQDHFHKFVRPRCGLAGHYVHTVTTRNRMTEYACDCGHSFLLPHAGLTKVRHPLICLFTGHSIKPFARLDGVQEFRCADCGHPFCFTS